ncbi:MAG: tRNA (adenosine(37)-N6)-threonylcarbamoyltransferase complex transferase subunit TsaD [Actinobacteria bacterium]|nr:tRNA (adenosine(37)-N6)-threonylcarbamoyltransferase complex transferase subunit TsaD [Actinomycetota bacterium]
MADVQQNFVADESTVVLGIETSCDETAVSVVMGGGDVLSSVVSSQLDEHARFGGVVPEIASRAHLEALPNVTAEALERAGIDFSRIDAVAATVGPGLVGALLVGVSAAKATALALDVPFVGVNHLEAHLYAALLDDPDVEFPMLFVLVSGGHTMFVAMNDPHDYRVVGQTIDDAAGEAFDKVARFLDLGFPGGPAIDRSAQNGNEKAVNFPRAMLNDGLDVSFSGLKTAVINHVRANPDVSNDDVAASFQRAVVDVLVHKARLAARECGARTIALGGGVAANSQLRRELEKAGNDDGLRVVLPSREMCTDNAAMIASAGWYRLRRGESTPLDAGANPNLKLARGQR